MAKEGRGEKSTGGVSARSPTLVALAQLAQRNVSRSRGRTAKHVVERDLGDDGELLVTDLGVDNRALALVDTANDVACTR